MTFVRGDLFITLNNLNIIIACYLIGSIPFGILISYDIKKTRSKVIWFKKYWSNKYSKNKWVEIRFTNIIF